jgi:hypothetical protein
MFPQDGEPEWVIQESIFAGSLLTANSLSKGSILLVNEGAVHCSASMLHQKQAEGKRRLLFSLD